MVHFPAPSTLFGTLICPVEVSTSKSLGERRVPATSPVVVVKLSSPASISRISTSPVFARTANRSAVHFDIRTSPVLAWANIHAEEHSVNCTSPVSVPTLSRFASFTRTKFISPVCEAIDIFGNEFVSDIVTSPVSVIIIKKDCIAIPLMTMSPVSLCTFANSNIHHAGIAISPVEVVIESR